MYKLPINTLTEEELKQYYDKVRIYKKYEPSFLFFGDSITYLYEPRKQKIINDDQYRDIIASTKGESKFYVGTKPTFEKITCGHMWDFEQSLELDSIDKKFIESRVELKKLKLFGYHSYAGFWQFFCPDLKEVILLLKDAVSIKELNDIECIYVSTVSHPTNSVSACYDKEKDMHKGLSICYVVMKDKIITKKRKSEVEPENMVKRHKT
jgi:thiol-disulfide isomerase/thioredoxin